MIERYQTRTSLAWLFLLTFLLAWVRSALGLPVISMIMGDSHNIFLTYRHDEFHLVFHHPENQDEHEHNLLANALANFTTEPDYYPDHEIHPLDHEQQVTTTTKMVKVSKTFPPLPTAQSLTKFVDLASLRHFPRFLPEVNTTLVCLCSIVLLI